MSKKNNDKPPGEFFREPEYLKYIVRQQKYYICLCYCASEKYVRFTAVSQPSYVTRTRPSWRFRGNSLSPNTFNLYSVKMTNAAKLMKDANFFKYAL